MSIEVHTEKPWADESPQPRRSPLSFRELAKHSVTRQFIQYIGVGGVAFLLDYCVFSLTFLAGSHYLLATAFGFCTGVATNYLLCLHWIWRGSQATTARDITVFIAIGVAGLGISVVVMYLAVEALTTPPLLAKLFATGIVFVWNFTLRKVFVFSH